MEFSPMCNRVSELSERSLGIKVWDNGSLFGLRFDQFSLNLFEGDYFQGNVGNIFFRYSIRGKIFCLPLVSSKNLCFRTSTSLIYGVQFLYGKLYLKLSFRDSLGAFFWDVLFDKKDENTTFDWVDCVFFQDVGLATSAHLLANESYNSHYVDHSVFENKDLGYFVSSRQNQPMLGYHPFVTHICLEGAVGYSTDGSSFFGNQARFDSIPKSLLCEEPLKDKKQGEFSAVALWGPKMNEDICRWTFCSFVQENHPEASSQEDLKDLQIPFERNWEWVKSIAIPYSQKNLLDSEILVGQVLSQRDIDVIWPERLLEEKKDGELLSFFTPEYNHVVLQAKENFQSRATAHVFFSGNPFENKLTDFSVVCYMDGQFGSQLSIGNTSIQKITSVSRTPYLLQFMKGIRILYKEQGGDWLRLGEPSSFEMKFRGACWTYRVPGNCITVFAYMPEDKDQYCIEVLSEKEADYLVVNHIIVGSEENNYGYDISFNDSCSSACVTPLSTNWKEKGEVANFYLHIQEEQENVVLKDDRALFSSYQSEQAPYIVVHAVNKNRFSFVYSLEDNISSEDTFTYSWGDKNLVFQECLKLFSLEEDHDCFQKIQVILLWFLHNMLIHYKVPRGIEQFNGAAWGVRDVSQGAVEGLLTLGQYSTVKKILKVLFLAQNEGVGDWPQWFMFDNYRDIRAGECHGDVVLWPIIACYNYVKQTNDIAFLDEKLPFYVKEGEESRQKSVVDHIKLVFEYIKKNSIRNTVLPSYMDGDWNDSLQPIDQSRREDLVSGWTTCLLYQALQCFIEMMEKKDDDGDLKSYYDYSAQLKEDFYKYFIDQEIISGFVYFNEQSYDKIFHPSTSNEGEPSYRLLPINRSILSCLLPVELLSKQKEIIEKYLFYKDGVRLLDSPITYNGGVSQNFKRAEQSAYWGREVSLQYMHAHIRFIEASCLVGWNDKLLESLMAVIPIQLKDTVDYAKIRQNNSYFTSSDACFKDRYDAEKNYPDLKLGDIEVAGGWRVYSSGPGIFYAIFIQRVLGVRMEWGDLVIDPVLPIEWDKVSFKINIRGVLFVIEYIPSEKFLIEIDGKPVSYPLMEHFYREDGGYRLPFDSCFGDKDTYHISYYYIK